MIHSYTIVAYSSHFGEEEGMELGWCKEAEDEIQIVVHGHCSMGLATPDKQVGHTHGLHVTAAVGPENVDMEQKQVEHGMEKAPGASYKREVGDHTQALQAALVADSKVLVAENLLAVVNWIFDSDVLLKGSCCKHLRFYYPGN